MGNTILRKVFIITTIQFFVGCSAQTADVPARKTKSSNATEDQVGENKTRPSKAQDEKNKNPDDKNPPSEEKDSNEKTDEKPSNDGRKTNLALGIDATNTMTRIGEVFGWAVDKDNPNTFLDVNVYIGEDKATAKKLKILKANLYGFDDENGGEHAFILVLDPSEITNKPLPLSFYAIVDGVEYPFQQNVSIINAFKPKGGSAQTVFNSIGFGSNSCRTCHSADVFKYENLWNRLAQDGFSPTNIGNPWSDSTNYLYEKMSGHKKGSIGPACGVINCDKIKDWWRAEFGQ